MTALAPEAAALSQWFTPEPLARRLVQWAGVGTGMRVLEPSAGSGAIVRELAERQPASIVAVEIDAALTCGLRARFGHPDPVQVVHGDFLRIAPLPVDVAVMNPPYEGGQDLAFVTRALEWAPRVVALLRLAFLAGSKRYRELWQCNTLSRLEILRSRPRFSGSSGSPKSDFAAFDIQRGRAPVGHATRVEWWG